MNDEIVHSIDEYIKKRDDLIYHGGYIYRGQCYSSWSLEPGIIRRIKKTYPGIGQSSVLFYNAKECTVDLIKKARTLPDFKNNECDLNILAMLQHYGAATLLLDFTYEPLVALYFACQPYIENNSEFDGKVFCINYSSQVKSEKSPVRSVVDPSRLCIESVFDPGGHRGIWHWTVPDDLPCKRSKRQQSVFVFGWSLYWEYQTSQLADELQTVIIPASSKKDILKVLDEKYDISEQTLFPDVQGFAQSNSYEKVIRHIDAEDFYAMGEKEWWDGKFEWSAEYFKMAFKKKPDWVDAICRHVLALRYEGYSLESASDIIEESIASLGENWKFLLCKAEISDGPEEDLEYLIKRAEQIANKANESQKFFMYIEKYLFSVSYLLERLDAGSSPA